MAHIPTPPGLPGIVGLFAFRPDTAKTLCELAESLLRSPGTLSSGERELIAAYVSRKNDCNFCSQSHGAAAQHWLKDQPGLVLQVWENYMTAPISTKMKSLLTIAGRVRESGKQVRAEDIASARKEGATDREIHDTVLIAAAFCMYNRYVDGLATISPPANAPEYLEMGRELAEEGYLKAGQASSSLN